MKARLPLLIAILLIFLAVVVPAASGGNSQTVFTISVTAPTLPDDVQVRYFLADGSGHHWTSTASRSDGNKIVIQINEEASQARSFKAILYAPGCQFATIQVDDLPSSTRQSEFQCQKLPTVQLRGHTAASVTSALAQVNPAPKKLQLETLYMTDWAQKFFDIPKGAISPFAVAKAPVAPDGSFSAELPDFTADPLWSSLTNDAALMLVLVDANNGRRIATLKPPLDLSRNDQLRVAPSYPEVEFDLAPKPEKPAGQQQAR